MTDGAGLGRSGSPLDPIWNPDDETSAAATLLDFATCRGLDPQSDPYKHMDRLLTFEEHEDIANGSAAIDWLFRLREKRKHGRRILGMCYANPGVQGDLGDLFDDMLRKLLGRTPDFLIVLDSEYWQDATPLQREILCHHEMMHAGQARDLFGAPRFDRDGHPVWALRDHDVSEFHSTVRRYGVHSDDVAQFLQAISDHIEGDH